MQQKDSFAKFTVSSRELGSAPANEAINILVIVAPRGIIILSLISTNCSSFTDFSRSKMSVKKVNIEWQASLEKSSSKYIVKHQFKSLKEKQLMMNNFREREGKPVLHCNSNHCAIYKRWKYRRRNE